MWQIPQGLKVDTGNRFTAASTQSFNANASSTLALDPGSGNSFTLSGWINIASFVSGIILWRAVNFGSGQACFILRTVPSSPTNGILFTVGNGSADFTTSVGGLSANTWYYVTASFNAATGALDLRVSTTAAIDTLTGTTTLTGTNYGVLTGGNMEVGARGYGLNPLDATLDSWGIHNKVLTLAERQALWNSGGGLVYADLSAALRSTLIEWWDFDSASGALVGRHAGTSLAASASRATRVDGISAGTAAQGDVIRLWNAAAGSPIFNTEELTFANRPIWALDSGVNCLEFDGSNDSLAFVTDWAGENNQGTIVAAVKRVSGTGSAALIGHQSSTRIGLEWSGASQVAAVCADIGGSGNLSIAQNLTQASWNCVAALWDNSNLFINVNGVEGGPGQSGDGSGPGTIRGLTLGGDGATRSAVRIAGAAIFSTPLGLPALKRVMRFLAPPGVTIAA